ncbi:MAG: cell division protein FtsQ/DivIB [Armatimonadetes bacterium]|nr:cell division protein FtsQ/DivIB [Armatimonadota bacterium]
MSNRSRSAGWAPPVARYNRRARRSFASVAAAWLAVILAVELGAAVYSSPMLDIKTVTFRLDPAATAEERAAVRRAATVQPGTSLPAFPSGRLEADLRKQTWVQGAWVAKGLKGLTVTVAARKAAAVLQGAAGPWEIDANGCAVRPARPRTGLPMVTIQAEWYPTAGKRVAGSPLDAALIVLARSGRLSPVQVRSVVVDRNVDVWLTTSDDLEVRLGQATNLPDKMARLARLYAKEPRLGKKLSVVNLQSLKWLSCVERGSPSGAKPL